MRSSVIELVFYLAIAFLLFIALVYFLWRQRHPGQRISAVLEEIREAILFQPLVVVLRESRESGTRIHLENTKCHVVYERFNSPHEAMGCKLKETAKTVRTFKATFSRKTGNVFGWRVNGRRIFRHIDHREKVAARVLLRQVRFFAGYE